MNPETELQTEPVEEQSEAPVENNKKYSDEEAQNMIKLRLKQANQKHETEKEQLKAEIAALKNLRESQSNMGAANTSGTTAPSTPDMQMPSEDVLNTVIARRQRQMDLSQKISAAREKDPEFAKLAEKSAHGGVIPGFAQESMAHLPNAVAVMKHLLKDPRDFRMAELHLQNGDEKGFVQYVNGLSEKLEKSVSKPAPSKYSEIPDMSDSGESGQDFDAESYIRDKY